MNTIKLSDINILDVGNTIQQWGSVFSDGKQLLLIPFPEENPTDIENLPKQILVMSIEEWERFLNQSDVLDVEMVNKAIVRKSQRHIDAFMQWRVYERDGYKCRYCGKKGIPLTIDHIILWEDSGATTEKNLLSACKRCNKLRGRTEYVDWLNSQTYKDLSKNLPEETKQINLEVVKTLDQLKSLRVNKVRSR